LCFLMCHSGDIIPFAAGIVNIKGKGSAVEGIMAFLSKIRILFLVYGYFGYIA
jgi:hypothetical protein